MLHRRPQQTLVGIVVHALLPYLRRAHVAIADQPFRTSESLPLPLTRRLHTRAGGFPTASVTRQHRPVGYGLQPATQPQAGARWHHTCQRQNEISMVPEAKLRGLVLGVKLSL